MRLRVVGVADILRVIHIVPDAADLCVRRGLGVAPPSFGHYGSEVVDMRYFIKALFPEMGD